MIARRWYWTEEGQQSALRRADTALSPRNVSIWRDHLAGAPLRKLAARHGVSRERIFQVVRLVARMVGLPAPRRKSRRAA